MPQTIQTEIVTWQITSIIWTCLSCKMKNSRKCRYFSSLNTNRFHEYGFLITKKQRNSLCWLVMYVSRKKLVRWYEKTNNDFEYCNWNNLREFNWKDCISQHFEMNLTSVSDNCKDIRLFLGLILNNSLIIIWKLWLRKKCWTEKNGKSKRIDVIKFLVPVLPCPSDTVSLDTQGQTYIGWSNIKKLIVERHKID